jgi:hypothetical protein
MDWKGTFKKIGKCVGLGVLGALLNHASGDNDGGKLGNDIKIAVIAGVASAIKTSGSEKE